MEIVCVIGQLYLLVIVVRLFMSWIPPTPGTTYATIYDFFYNITEPVLAPLRGLIPPVSMGVTRLDLSPLILLLGGPILLRVIGCGGGLFG
ncbi:MAG: YggT family protein [Acidimicrobiales bacterium]